MNTRAVDSKGSGDVCKLQRWIVVDSEVVAARCFLVVVSRGELIGARLNRGLSEKKQGTVRSQVEIDS